MEKGNSLNIGQKLLLAFSLILIVFGIVTTVLDIVKTGYSSGFLFNLIVYVCVGFYVVFDYKKPHGNSLSFVMIVFAMSLACMLSKNHEIIEDPVPQLISMVAIGSSCVLVSYMSGRLDRVNQNVTFAIIVLAMLLFVDFYLVFALGTKIYSLFSVSIQWIVMMASYFIRYKQHRQAGNRVKKD